MEVLVSRAGLLESGRLVQLISRLEAGAFGPRG